MPVDTEHARQISHNAQLLSGPLLDISETEYLDWVITIMFYNAVHKVRDRTRGTAAVHSASS